MSTAVTSGVLGRSAAPPPSQDSTDGQSNLDTVAQQINQADPNGFYQQASAFDRVAERLRDVTNQFRNQTRQLEAAWTGTSSTAYSGHATRLSNQVEQLLQALENPGYGNALRQSGDALATGQRRLRDLQKQRAQDQAANPQNAASNNAQYDFQARQILRDLATAYEQAGRQMPELPGITVRGNPLPSTPAGPPPRADGEQVTATPVAHGGRAASVIPQQAANDSPPGVGSWVAGARSPGAANDSAAVAPAATGGDQGPAAGQGSPIVGSGSDTQPTGFVPMALGGMWAAGQPSEPVLGRNAMRGGRDFSGSAGDTQKSSSTGPDGWWLQQPGALGLDTASTGQPSDRASRRQTDSRTGDSVASQPDSASSSQDCCGSAGDSAHQADHGQRHSAGSQPSLAADKANNANPANSANNAIANGSDSALGKVAQHANPLLDGLTSQHGLTGHNGLLHDGVLRSAASTGSSASPNAAAPAPAADAAGVDKAVAPHVASAHTPHPASTAPATARTTEQPRVPHTQSDAAQVPLPHSTEIPATVSTGFDTSPSAPHAVTGPPQISSADAVAGQPASAQNGPGALPVTSTGSAALDSTVNASPGTAAGMGARPMMPPGMSMAGMGDAQRQHLVSLTSDPDTWEPTDGPLGRETPPGVVGRFFPRPEMSEPTDANEGDSGE